MGRGAADLLVVLRRPLWLQRSARPHVGGLADGGQLVRRRAGTSGRLTSVRALGVDGGSGPARPRTRTLCASGTLSAGVDNTARCRLHALAAQCHA